MFAGLTRSAPSIYSVNMCTCDTLSCTFLCHPSPNGPFSKKKTHTETGGHDTNDSYLTSYCGAPSPVVATAHLRTKGDIQAFQVTENLEYAQQPFDDVFDYWFHQLGVPFDVTLAPTLWGLPTLSSVFGGVTPPVSPNSIMLYYLGWVLGACVCIEGGLLIRFH